MSKKPPPKNPTATATAIVKSTAARKIATKVGDFSPVGAPRRLSDPDVKPKLDALREKLSKDPEAARRFLQEVGYLTPKGNVTARYS